MFLTKDQVGSVTVDELRTELHKFASEVILHENLRRAVHQDVQAMLVDLQAALLEGVNEEVQKNLIDQQSAFYTALRGGVQQDIQKMFIDFQAALLEQLAPAGRLQVPLEDRGSAARAYTGNANGILRTAALQDNGVALVTAVNVRDCDISMIPPLELPGTAVDQVVEAKSKLSSNEVDSFSSDEVDSPARKGSSASHSSQADSEGREESRSRRSSGGSEKDLSRVMSAARASQRGGAPMDAQIRSSMSMLTGIPDNPTSCQSRLIRTIQHHNFEYFTAGFILLNGVLIGVQSDYVTRENVEEPPAIFEVLEYLFCVVFTAELALRLFVYRWRFFTMIGWGWNVFDCLIVFLQLVEICLKVVSSGLNLNFNVLRILRLTRIVRLARVLRLIGELRTIVQSIGNSLKPLFWTAVLLFMMVYVLGIFMTQAVHTKKMELLKDNKAIPAPLEDYWGSLVMSMFSLFESITGGLDWDKVCRPLIDHIGPEIGIVFCGYILFTVFAMLNVITGVFIDSVMTYATDEKEKRQIGHVQTLFKKLDIDDSGEITWEEFQEQLKHKEMRDFFKTIDVDIEKAQGLFELLDLDASGSVDVSEFMDGCLRIWAPPKGLDLRMILRDVNKVLCMQKKQNRGKSFHEDDENEDSGNVTQTSPKLGSMSRPRLQED